MATTITVIVIIVEETIPIMTGIMRTVTITVTITGMTGIEINAEAIIGTTTVTVVTTDTKTTRGFNRTISSRP